MYYQKLDDFVGLDDLNSLWGLGAVSCKTLESRKNSAWRTATTQQRQRDAAQTKLDACATKNARRAASSKDPYYYCQSQQKAVTTQTNQYTAAYNKAVDLDGQLAICQAGAGAAVPGVTDSGAVTAAQQKLLDKLRTAQIKADAKAQAAQAKADAKAAALTAKVEQARIKAEGKAELARIKAEAKAEAARLKAEGKSEHILRASAAKEIAMARASCKKSGMIFQLTSAYPAEYVCNPGYQDTSVPAGYTDPSTLLPPDMTTQPPPPGFVDTGGAAPPPAGTPQPYPGAVPSGALPYGTSVVDQSAYGAPGAGGAYGATGGVPAGYAVDPATGQLVPADQGPVSMSTTAEAPTGAMGASGWLVLGALTIGLLYFVGQTAKKRKKEGGTMAGVSF